MKSATFANTVREIIAESRWEGKSLVVEPNMAEIARRIGRSRAAVCKVKDNLLQHGTLVRTYKSHGRIASVYEWENLDFVAAFDRSKVRKVPANNKKRKNRHPSLRGVHKNNYERSDTPPWHTTIDQLTPGRKRYIYYRFRYLLKSNGCNGAVRAKAMNAIVPAVQHETLGNVRWLYKRVKRLVRRLKSKADRLIRAIYRLLRGKLRPKPWGKPPPKPLAPGDPNDPLQLPETEGRLERKKKARARRESYRRYQPGLFQPGGSNEPIFMNAYEPVIEWLGQRSGGVPDWVNEGLYRVQICWEHGEPAERCCRCRRVEERLRAEVRANERRVEMLEQHLELFPEEERATEFMRLERARHRLTLARQRLASWEVDHVSQLGSDAQEPSPEDLPEQEGIRRAGLSERSSTEASSPSGAGGGISGGAAGREGEQDMGRGDKERPDASESIEEKMRRFLQKANEIRGSP